MEPTTLRVEMRWEKKRDNDDGDKHNNEIGFELNAIEWSDI